MSGQVERIGKAVRQMLEEPGVDWWRFVPCGYCNAHRQRGCEVMDGPARRPHAARRRDGAVLWQTMWLIGRGYEGDVLAPQQHVTAPQSASGAESDHGGRGDGEGLG